MGNAPSVGDGAAGKCGDVQPEWAGHLAGAGFALRCWLCSASADVVMRRVYGALLVPMLVVRPVCAESGRV